MPTLSNSSPQEGKVSFVSQKLVTRMRQAGLTKYELRNKSAVDLRTINRMLSGQPVRWSSASEILHVLGITDPFVYAVDTSQADSSAAMDPSPLVEWTFEHPLTPVITAANGLQFRLYKLQHRLDPKRRGRGKRYEFDHCASDTQVELHNLMLRHMRTCDEVQRHPQVPICLGTFPEPGSRAWWVVDLWQEGTMLADLISADEKLPIATIRKCLLEIAVGLQAFHRAEILLRELSPATILLADPDQHVVLTDFELAKFSDGSPSVSRDWGEKNPYRAPEVGGKSIDAGVDLYSWGRIATQLVTGHLPTRGQESRALSVAEIPAKLKDLIGQCVAIRRSARPTAIDDLLTGLRRWK